MIPSKLMVVFFKKKNSVVIQFIFSTSIFSFMVLFIVCSILINAFVCMFSFFIQKEIIWQDSDSAHSSHLSCYNFLFNRWSLLFHTDSHTVLSHY